MDKMLKYAALVVAVGAAVQAFREIYVGRLTAQRRIPPGHHMHPDGTIMADSAMKKPCCSNCASGLPCA